MKPRLIPFIAAPAMMQKFVDFSTEMAKDLVEPALAELVKIRASQINRCAFCLHMHTREALAAGESELRITMLAAWRESPLYSERERAALAWTEALTLLPETGAPDDVYAELAAHFTPEEQVKLTMTISLINAWNRFGAGFHAVHAMPKPVAVAA
jgi:AhpD family alkylhydroperoxidase